MSQIKEYNSRWLVTESTPSKKRKQRRFIWFLLFPVFLPHQAKAMSLFSWVLQPFERKAKKASLSPSLGVAFKNIKLDTNAETYSSISVTAFSLRCLINSAGFCARPRMAVFPAKPRHIAQTIVLFPVPFGPMITLSRGPG